MRRLLDGVFDDRAAQDRPRERQEVAVRDDDLDQRFEAEEGRIVGHREGDMEASRGSQRMGGEYRALDRDQERRSSENHEASVLGRQAEVDPQLGEGRGSGDSGFEQGVGSDREVFGQKVGLDRGRLGRHGGRRCKKERPEKEKNSHARCLRPKTPRLRGQGGKFPTRAASLGELYTGCKVSPQKNGPRAGFFKNFSQHPQGGLRSGRTEVLGPLQSGPDLDGRSPARGRTMMVRILGICLPCAVFFGVFLSGTGWSQGGFPLARWMPARDGGAPPGDAERRELRDLGRLLRKGSPSDREDLRARLLQGVPRLLPAILEDLNSGNQVEQLPLALVMLQVREPDAIPVLEQIVGGGRRGQRGILALALGRMGAPSSFEPLARLAESSRPDDRLRAILAIGRLGGEEASRWLGARLKEASLAREQEAIGLAMGMVRSRAHLPQLIAMAQSSQDPLRRVAVLALALSPAEDDRIVAVLAGLLRDQDPQVRIYALRGLVQRNPSPESWPQVRQARPATAGEEEEAEWTFLELSMAGPAGFADVPAAESHRTLVRAAVAAAALRTGGATATATGRRLLSDSNSDVQLVALLASIAAAQGSGGTAGLSSFANHSDNLIREVALLGDVYVRGIQARPFLEDCLSTELKVDVRRLATDLLNQMDAWPDAVASVCWARLQAILDDTGFAASFNVQRALNGQILRLFGIESTGAFRIRRAAQPQGGSGTGEVAPRRTSPEDEDLRRHLERYPYEDRRTWTELSRPRRGQDI